LPPKFVFTTSTFGQPLSYSHPPKPHHLQKAYTK
jgi:hypothetical protein